MPIATIPQAINRGYVSIYLCGNDNAKGNIFGARIAAPGSQITINMVTDALYWGYMGGAQSTQDLRSMANYLIWLIGMYGQQAQNILDSGGGGSVVPINPGGGTPLFYDFVVSGVSFIATGTTIKQFPSTWIGWNVQFFRSGNLQTSTIPEIGTYYSWNSNTAILTLLSVSGTAAADTGERFQIYPTL